MDPYEEAVELLFRYYVAEDFYDEQWSAADDLASEFLDLARKGWKAVVMKVEHSLEFDVTFGYSGSLYPVTGENFTQRFRDKLNGHDNAENLIKAAELVWAKFMTPNGCRARALTNLGTDVMMLAAREFNGRVAAKIYANDGGGVVLPTYVLEFPSEKHARDFFYNNPTIKDVTL